MAVNRLSKHLLFLFLCCCFSLSFSANPPINSEQFLTNLHSAGITLKQNAQSVDILVDFDTALAIVPNLAERGAFNPATTQRDIFSHPVAYATTVGLLYTTLILAYLYQTSQANQLHINLYLVRADEDDEQDDLYASFDFNRKDYETTDWNHFSIKNLTE